MRYDRSTAQHARRPATYAELEALPENMVGEIVDGELFASPRPGDEVVRAEPFDAIELPLAKLWER